MEIPEMPKPPNPEDVEPRQCRSCGDWFKPGVVRPNESCLVWHSGGCCHFNDKRVEPPEAAHD